MNFTYLNNILWSTALKGLFVITAVFFVTSILRKASACTKHMLWFLSICSLAIIPLVSVIIPNYNFEIPIYSPHVEKAILYASRDSLNPNTSDIQIKEKPNQNNSSSFVQHNRYWIELLTVGWIIGVLLSLAHFILGKISLSKITYKTRPYTGCEAQVKRIMDEYGIHKPVRLFRTIKTLIPTTAGVISPVILLPDEVINWPEERLEIVLHHELAHIKRNDCLTQYISRIICALFWFLPVVWLAYSKQRFEQENASDAFVMNSGIIPFTYARHLVEIVRSATVHIRHYKTDLNFGRKNMLEKRVINILSERWKKHSPLSSKRIWKTAIICLCFIIPLAVVKPVLADNDEDGDKDSHKTGKKMYVISTQKDAEIDSAELMLKNMMNASETVMWGVDLNGNFYTIIPHTDEPLNLNSEIPIVWPVKDKNGQRKGYITLNYGWATNPFSGHKFFHTGLDIAWAPGTPIIATADGVIENVGYIPGSLGNYILIRHKYGFSTHYTHLNKILVTEGSVINKGQVIGLMGNSGITTGPHLHYEIRIGSKASDPITFLDPLTFIDKTLTITETDL